MHIGAYLINFFAYYCYFLLDKRINMQEKTQINPQGKECTVQLGSERQKILLAFSGGLDTSAIIPWLKEHYNADVIAYCSDLGNSPDGAYLKKWAIELGASEFIFDDLRDEFAQKYVFPAMRAGATYQDDYLLGTALARPLISERMAYYAKKVGASAIAHGATGKGNDQIRFEKSWAYLVPEMAVIAPWKIWDFKGRADLAAYLTEKGFPTNAEEKIYSVDVNLMHRSCEGGVLEHIQQEYNPNEIYEWVAPPEVVKTLKDSTNVRIQFEQGLPVAVNGEEYSPALLLAFLNEIAGNAGFGVLDLVEERTIGMKGRGIYETPGASLLALAAKSLKHICWDRALLTTARTLANQYGDIIYDGAWHSDVRAAIESFFVKASETLTGEVGVRLEAGMARISSRQSPYSLYDSGSVTFEEDTDGIHHAALGYCKIIRSSQQRLGKRAAKFAAAQANLSEFVSLQEGKSAPETISPQADADV